MQTAELPTTPNDDPARVQPLVGEANPDDQTTEVLPATGDTTAEQQAAELFEPDNYGRALPAHIEGHVGRIVLADRNGDMPKRGRGRENWLRPETPFWGWPVFRYASPGHPHKHKINAVKPKVEQAIEARQKGFDYGDHDASINAAQGAIRSLAIKLHVNEFNPSQAVIPAGASDHTGHRRTGYGTVQYRRPLSKLATHAKLMYTPEDQVAGESKRALRDIGKMHNLSFHLAEVDAMDETGSLGHALQSGSPQAVGHELGVLSAQNVISEHNPLHARWSEAMDPRNVQRLKQWLVEFSSEQQTGESSATALLHISAVGIMGSVRPRVVADYLGVEYPEWDEQRYGMKSGENQLHKVPKEVVDQICFLMKLDNRYVGGTVTGDNGKDRPKTALDVLIENDAAQPLTEVLQPEYKDPMKRVTNENNVQARNALELQDREIERMNRLNALVGTDLEALGRRLAELSEDDEEYADLSKQRAGIVRKLKNSGIPVPSFLNGGNSNN